MVFREVSVIEVREVLRAWLAGKSERAVAAQADVDRKTSRRYVGAAVAAGTRTAAWKGIPSWAVVETEDRVIPPATQRRMAGRARRSPRSRDRTCQ